MDTVDIVINILAVLGLFFILLWFVCGWMAYALQARIKSKNKTFKAFVVNLFLGMVALAITFYFATKNSHKE